MSTETEAAVRLSPLGGAWKVTAIEANDAAGAAEILAHFNSGVVISFPEEAAREIAVGDLFVRQFVRCPRPEEST